jgi:spermidine synthase
MNLALHFALLLMGFGFTVTQVMVLRELLVVFSGNELSIAIILANWLFLGAAGSFLLGRKVEDFSLRRGTYAFLQVLLSVFFLLTILAIRYLKDLMGLSPGEGASLGQIFFWTLPLLAPLGMVEGLMFSLGCILYGEFKKKAASSIGNVYLLEALGAGAGGALYTFLFVPWMTSFQVAFLVGGVQFFSAFLMLVFDNGKGKFRRKISLAAIGLLLIGDLGLLFFPAIWDLERISQGWQWRGLEVLESCWSSFGNITVGKREEQLTFFANGMPILTSPVPDMAAIEELVHFPLLLEPAPEKILVVGGGFGGVIREVLKHPVKEVHYVEIDPLLMDMIEKNPTSLTREEFANPKVRVHMIDARYLIRAMPVKFDSLIMNLPGPFTLQLNRFYTVEFFQEVFNLLEDEGIFAFFLPGSETYFSREIRDLNVSLIQSLKEVFPSIWVIPGSSNLVLAAKWAMLGPISQAAMVERLRSRNISPLYLTDLQIQQKLDPQRQRWMEDSFRQGRKVRENRDAQPSGLYYGIGFWNAEFHPSFQRFWGRLNYLQFGQVAVLIFLATGGGLFFRKKRRNAQNRWVLAWIVSTTGFFGIAMSILVIFSFQTLHGYMVEWIGLLIAVFMGGLALGSWRMSRMLERIRNYRQALWLTELGITVWAALGMFAFFIFFSPDFEKTKFSLMLAGFLLLSGGAGYWVGMEFPLSNVIFYGPRGNIARAAGFLYAADLMGAWAGSLLVGVILIPVLGILQTCGVVILLKAGSGLLVRRLHKFS